MGGNKLVNRAGYLRNVPVSIGGTTWKPDMPIESRMKEEIAEIGQIEKPTDRALTMMLYLVRKQMFLDGNKRTSMPAGNHVMIGSGCGIISIPIELQPAFTGLLIQFYESNDMTEINIDGIAFTPLPEQETERGRENLQGWER